MQVYCDLSELEYSSAASGLLHWEGAGPGGRTRCRVRCPGRVLRQVGQIVGQRGEAGESDVLEQLGAVRQELRLLAAQLSSHLQQCSQHSAEKSTSS